MKMSGPKAGQSVAPNGTQSLASDHGRPTLLARKYLLSPTCTIGCACIALIWGLAILRSIELRQQDIADSARDALNIALVVERSVREAINHADHLLTLVRSRKESERSTSWTDILDHNYNPGPNGIQMAVIGPDGYRDATTRRADRSAGGTIPRGANLSDREHFKFHIHSHQDELFISKPVIGRSTGLRALQLTRGYRNLDGSFGGVIVASLDPIALIQTFQQLNLGAGGGVAILGSDDVFRAGTGAFSQLVGTSYREPQKASKIDVRSVGKLSAIYDVEKQTADGKDRLVASQPVAGLPLTVMVATTNGLNSN